MALFDIGLLIPNPCSEIRTFEDDDYYEGFIDSSFKRDIDLNFINQMTYLTTFISLDSKNLSNKHKDIGFSKLVSKPYDQIIFIDFLIQ